MGWFLCKTSVGRGDEWLIWSLALVGSDVELGDLIMEVVTVVEAKAW